MESTEEPNPIFDIPKFDNRVNLKGKNISKAAGNTVVPNKGSIW